MEQHFLDYGKSAWDAVDRAPRPRPPSLLISEDSGPWPLPFYPVLGESAGNYDAYGGQLLCSPCWRLPSVYGTYRLLTAAQSSWEGSPAQASLGPSPETPETPETPESPAEPARESEPAEETPSPGPAQEPWPSARDGQQMAEKFEGPRPAERRPPRAPAARCPHPDFSGCLRWVRRAVCSLSRAAAGCCGVFRDLKGP
ncbi:annexin-2 receptor-like [Artibeus jamaicensis]|uniref:annexin-2 receptor-like n=1 Tax=Artibeus jamaicensis TaxID=9417 RepID=UPI00235AA996|nr:annexin-2 receptor-like [Artibeus jamaicensis]